jgi:hypothetical protein
MKKMKMKKKRKKKRKRKMKKMQKKKKRKKKRKRIPRILSVKTASSLFSIVFLPFSVPVCYVGIHLLVTILGKGFCFFENESSIQVWFCLGTNTTLLYLMCFYYFYVLQN